MGRLHCVGRRWRHYHARPWRLRLHGRDRRRGNRRGRNPDLDGRRRNADRRSHHSSGRVSREDVLVRRGRRAPGVFRSERSLHPATVIPAIEKNIPVRILNSRRPECEGTLIVAEAPACSNAIRSIACKRNITLVNIVSTRMLGAHGFLRRIFEVFDRFETSVDMLATSEVGAEVADGRGNIASLAAIRAELESFAEVSMEENQAIVCLVGENIRRSAGRGGPRFRRDRCDQRPNDLARRVAAEYRVL